MGLGGAAGAALYSAAKHGILGLSKSAALEYARNGIRINALCAGFFQTPMLKKALLASNPADPAATEQMYTNLIPLGRIGTPSEAADAIAWMCSEGSSYLNGHSLILDGGFTALMR